MLLEKYSSPKNLTDDQLYELASAVRLIGTNYGSVSLLKLSLDQVNSGIDIQTLI